MAGRMPSDHLLGMTALIAEVRGLSEEYKSSLGRGAMSFDPTKTLGGTSPSKTKRMRKVTLEGFSHASAETIIQRRTV
jgi:hypothetical protein